jgi:hypothetical protein
VQQRTIDGRSAHPLGDVGERELEAWREGDSAYDAKDLLGTGYGYNPLEIDASNAGRAVTDGYREAHDERRDARIEGLEARIEALEARIETLSARRDPTQRPQP